MKALESMHPPVLFIDIGQTSFQALYGEENFSFPIERAENGRLSDLCRERLTLGLRGFLSNKSRAAGQIAYCAIAARGVSIRRLSLPASSDEEQQRVLRLQIESEFPLSPDELAWGSRRIDSSKLPGNGGPTRQDFLVVAVKKEVLEEYATLLAACGIVPSFNLAALARAELYPPLSGACAVLDIGRTHSELTTFENGVPISIRILAWGGETITRSIQEKLAVSHDEAEKLKLTSEQPAVALGPQGQSLQSATISALATLAANIKSASLGEKLYLTGKTARDRRVAPLLAGALGGVFPCESLEPLADGCPSAAIAGLKKSTRKDSAPSLVLALNGGHAPAALARPAVWKWAAAAAILALAALIFPYAEALVFKPFLERKLASLEADRGRLVTIDQELDFLKSLKQSQPPYLDAIYLMARSAPQGTHLDELSMNRQRQISIRMKMANGQQVTEFRSKLIDSGWFTNVMVEEQAPSPDRRFAVRMTAELRPAEFRKALAAEPPGKRAEPGLVAAAPEPMMMPVPPPMGMPEAVPAPNPAGEIAPSPPPDGQDTSAPGPARRRIRKQPTSQP